MSSREQLLLVRFGDRTFESIQSEFQDENLVYVDSLRFAQNTAESYTAALGNINSHEFVEKAINLRWVQSFSAGVNAYPLELMKQRDIVLTNAAGIYGPNIADHTIALALMLCRKIEPIRRAALQKGWPEQKRTPAPGELAGQTMLVLGLGGIGIETAKRAAGLGMRVIATRRHSSRSKPDFVDAVHPPDQLHSLLPEADWVTICLPYTSDTADLISTPEFGRMKTGAHVLCATRGGIINTKALMAALDGGVVGGAGLDVTDPEPLPVDHPLWRYENVIITPHQSGYSEAANERLEQLIRENVRNFLNGAPLRNIVDLDLQY